MSVTSHDVARMTPSGSAVARRDGTPVHVSTPGASTLIMNADVVERMLARAAAVSRPAKVDVVLRHLGVMGAEVHLAVCELAWEVHTREYWTRYRRAGGATYRSEVDYFRDALGLDHLKRSAVYQRLRLGKAIASFAPHERNWLRDRLSDLGVSKALALAPAVQRAPHAAVFGAWVTYAVEHTATEVRRAVAEVTGAQPRGVQRHPPCPLCGRPWDPRRRLKTEHPGSRTGTPAGRGDG